MRHSRFSRYSWRMLLCLLPIFWISGNILMGLPSFMHATLVGPQEGNYDWLVALVVRVLVISLMLSIIAQVLGVASLRTLLTLRQALLFGLLATAILCVAWTGLVWARMHDDETLFFLWRVIAGAAFDLFALIWLVLGVRAAASSQALRSGALLLCATAGTFVISYAGLLALYFNADPESSPFVLGLLVLCIIGLLLLPDALATAGMAAIWSGLRQALAAAPDKPRNPPEPPPT